MGRVNANLFQLRMHTGPWHRHWQTRLVASLGGVLVDDRADEG